MSILLVLWSQFRRITQFLLLASVVQVMVLDMARVVEGVPVSAPNANANCPVPTTNTEFGTTKVLDLHEIKGHKVRLQFFYPSEESSRRLLESAEATTTTTTTTTTLSPVGTIKFRNRKALSNSDNSTVNKVNSGEMGDSTSSSVEKESDLYAQDIHCQWTFRAGNESQLLSLTFEKLSAPYSDNCEQAYVALQKADGYESRWCGNRRQANARPMSLLSRSSAVITVFRSGDSPLLPPTGFKVSVKELDADSLQGIESSLRVLYG